MYVFNTFSQKIRITKHNRFDTTLPKWFCVLGNSESITKTGDIKVDRAEKSKKVI